MKKIFKHILLILLWSTGLAVFGQDKSSALKIGDKVPDVILMHIYHPKNNQEIRISALHQKKLLLLSFWATWCVPCIREMRKLDTLVKKYGKDMNVLYISHENTSDIQAFFPKHKEIDVTGFTVLSDDVQFNKFFPHVALPHNVWIDSLGIVQAITDDVQVNEENIKLFLSGTKTNEHVKVDDMSFSRDKPYSAPEELQIFRSILAKRNPGILSSASTYPSSAGFVTRMLCTNLRMIDLFWLSSFKRLKDGQSLNWKRFKFITTDSLKYFQPKSVKNTGYKHRLDWYEDNHVFCYELAYQKPVPDSVFYEQMLQDVSRNFGVKASIIKRKQLCVVLTYIGEKPYPKSTSGEKQFSISGAGIQASCVLIDDLIPEVLDSFRNPDLIINETKIDYPIDLTLLNPEKEKSFSFEMLLNSLEHQGFKVKKEMRKVDVLELKEEGK